MRRAVAAAAVVAIVGASAPSFAATHLKQFQAPSGNIGCVRCANAHGRGFSLSRQSVRFF